MHGPRLMCRGEVLETFGQLAGSFKVSRNSRFHWSHFLLRKVHIPVGKCIFLRESPFFCSLLMNGSLFLSMPNMIGRPGHRDDE